MLISCWSIAKLKKKHVKYTEQGLRARARRRTWQVFAFPPFSPSARHMTIKRTVRVRVRDQGQVRVRLGLVLGQGELVGVRLVGQDQEVTSQVRSPFCCIYFSFAYLFINYFYLFIFLLTERLEKSKLDSPGHNQIWIYDDVIHICKMAPTTRNTREGHFLALCCAQKCPFPILL